MNCRTTGACAARSGSCRETNEFRSAVGAGMFLSDPGRRLQKDLDIAEYTDPDHNPALLCADTFGGANTQGRLAP